MIKLGARFWDDKNYRSLIPDGIDNYGLYRCIVEEMMPTRFDDTADFEWRMTGTVIVRKSYLESLEVIA